MAETSVQRRPRNRKQLIVAAAARQFQVRGFHDVAVADIAAEVGITGSALYRHFGGKNDLLVATIETEIEQLAAIYGSGAPDLKGLLDGAARMVLARELPATLWERNHLLVEESQQPELNRRYLEALRPLRDMVATERSELTADEVEVLTWATHSVLIGVRAYQRVKLDKARARRLLAHAAYAVVTLDDLSLRNPMTKPPMVLEGRILPVSRRESALLVAVALFAERGYQAVGMDEIAATAGVSVPTLYNHFPGKSAILVTAIMRCLEALYFDLSGALAQGSDPARALEKALASYVRINVDQGDALGALTFEIINVPQDERVEIRRMQRDYINEWAALLVQVRPDREQVEAETLVRSTQTVLNLMRGHVPKEHPDPQSLLRQVGRAILGIPAPSEA